MSDFTSNASLTALKIELERPPGPAGPPGPAAAHPEAS
jgi:hypothetical protein